jgi:hypothetical protein
MSQADKIISITEPGWDGLDADVNAFRVRDIDKQREEDLLFAKTFGTKEGIKLLEYLTKRFLDQPCFVPEAKPRYGYMREGQNSIIREIKTRVRRGNEPR